MGVQLREKKMKDGQISFYLDIYHNKRRWYEFLDIHISRTKPTETDREKKRMAVEIRAKRENELIVNENGLTDKSKRKADFVVWFEQYMQERNLHYTHNYSTLAHLKKYQGGHPLPFHTITVDWLKTYTKYLLTKVSNNTTMDYLKNMFTAFEDAVRVGIILQNPLRLIPRHEKLKRKKAHRRPFTLEELQLLIDTPCKMPYQFRQAFIFDCFCGLRWSDLNALKWSEIIEKRIDGQEEWFMSFEQEKTGEVEYLPLTEQAVMILKERKRERLENNEASLYVFPLVKEKNRQTKTTEKTFAYYIKKWGKAAGIESSRMHAHNARHTFATNMLEHSPEADLWTVSKLLGHRTIDATQIYAKVRDSKRRAAVRSLPTLNINSSAA